MKSPTIKITSYRDAISFSRADKEEGGPGFGRFRLEGFESIEEVNRVADELCEAAKRKRVAASLELVAGGDIWIDEGVPLHPSITRLIWRSIRPIPLIPRACLSRLILVGVDLTGAGSIFEARTSFLTLSFCKFEDEVALQRWLPRTLVDLRVTHPCYARRSRPDPNAWPKKISSLTWPCTAIDLGDLPGTLRELNLPEASIVEGREFPKGLKRLAMPWVHLTLDEELASATKSLALDTLVVGSVRASHLNSHLRDLEVTRELLFDEELPPRLDRLALTSPDRFVFVFGKREPLTFETLKELANRKALTKLVLENYFGESLRDVPPNLTQLRLGAGFDGSLEGLPEGLASLSLGDSFDRGLKPLQKLKKLSRLTLGDKFNRSLACLPEAIRYLKLGRAFDRSLAKLPPKIEELCLHRAYKRPLVDLPKSLKLLRLHYYCEADRSSLPPDLKVEYFGDKIDSAFINSI